MRTYLWEFRGGHGEGTAKHFRLHLQQFLEDHALGECETGVVTLAPLRFAAFCRAPKHAQEVIEKALRPPRFSDEPPPG